MGVTRPKGMGRQIAWIKPTSPRVSCAASRSRRDADSFMADAFQHPPPAAWEAIPPKLTTQQIGRLGELLVQ
jgi:hypothetical protein